MTSFCLLISKTRIRRLFVRLRAETIVILRDPDPIVQSRRLALPNQWKKLLIEAFLPQKNQATFLAVPKRKEKAKTLLVDPILGRSLATISLSISPMHSTHAYSTGIHINGVSTCRKS